MYCRIFFPGIIIALFITTSLVKAEPIFENDTTDDYLVLDFDSSVRYRVLESREAEENCSERSIYQFPADLFTREQRKRGAIILHFFGGFYAFLLVALVCNDYFLPSVDCICTDLRISRDVAAATFMATATCTPELFVNLIGTLLTESDLGIGAVVGSGVFNTFGVAACSGLAAAGVIQMEWWPLSRDCLIYSIAIGAMTIMMWDGIIELSESIILITLYFVYFIILFCDKPLSRWAHKIAGTFSKPKTLEETTNKNASPEEFDDMGIYRPHFHGELIIAYRKYSITNSISKRTSVDNTPIDIILDEIDEEYEPPGTPFTIPKGTSIYQKLWWWFLWPLRFILFITVPDCRFKKVKKFYPFTFVMCIFWIAITSYFVSWMITVVGDTIGIADAVMGLTFLAAGGSLPEAVSSVIMARQGDGAMGLSNSIGANTLDIFLCLGLPWLIKTASTGTDVEIVSSSIIFSFFGMLVTVVILFLAIALNKFRLNKVLGGISLALYVAFIVVSVLLEMNVFFFVNWPMCDPTD